jgi:hypothetical protein
MFKTCPGCSQEYQAWATRCAQCELVLEFASDLRAQAPRGEGGGGGDALPPASELVLVELQGPWYLEELAQALAEHGISSRVDAHADAAEARRAGQPAPLGLYVRPDDFRDARALAQEFARARLPDAESAATAPRLAAECPACGEPVRGDAASCAECGLEFPEGELRCFACGEPAAPDAARCARCGADFDEAGA